jgi:hypothetical protein
VESGNLLVLKRHTHRENLGELWLRTGPQHGATATCRVASAAVGGLDMLGTILAYLIALLGLTTISGGAWALFKAFQNLRLLFFQFRLATDASLGFPTDRLKVGLNLADLGLRGLARFYALACP